MRRSCLDCEYFDKEHYDMYEEAICTKADETIRLRRGQYHPRWCPEVHGMPDIASYQNGYYQSTLSILRQELINTEIAYKHILQNNLTNAVAPASSGTYLYGGWMPTPQVCCTSGPEKTNCINCGASLRGHYRCEYCGTVNN